MAKKNIAKKSVKKNTTDVWATVDRESNEAVAFFASRSTARMNRGENEAVRGFTLVPKKH